MFVIKKTRQTNRQGSNYTHDRVTATKCENWPPVYMPCNLGINRCKQSVIHRKTSVWFSFEKKIVITAGIMKNDDPVE